MGQIWVFLRSVFSTFGFVPFGVNMTQLGANRDSPGYSAKVKGDLPMTIIEMGTAMNIPRRIVKPTVERMMINVLFKKPTIPLDSLFACLTRPNIDS